MGKPQGRTFVSLSRSTIVRLGPDASTRETNVQLLHRNAGSFGRPSTNGTAMAARVYGFFEKWDFFWDAVFRAAIVSA